jgi:signal peptidase complex subunit 2
LTSLKFRQSHFYADVRLALGYTAVIIAAGTFVADYKLGWDATKYWTAWAVVIYFILNGLFTYWTWAVEKGMIFLGEKGGKQVWMDPRSTSMPHKGKERKRGDFLSLTRPE